MQQKPTPYSMQSIVDAAPIIVTAKVSDFDIDLLSQFLSQNEIEQMRRYRQAADGKRYVVAHALKRLCLSQFLNTSTELLSFDQQKFGKPYCCQMSSPFFNLSHSHDWVVMAVSQQNEVGVDIDFPRNVDHYSLIKRICSKEQVQHYLDAEVPEITFLHFWVQKEAISKANGQGISVGMANIASSGEPKVEIVTLLSKDYSLYTYSWQDDGVLAYAELMPDESLGEGQVQAPRIFQWMSLEKTGNYVDCVLFEL